MHLKADTYFEIGIGPMQVHLTNQSPNTRLNKRWHPKMHYIIAPMFSDALIG